ncbi:LpqB family beta-propeller domain-containing protein [Actinopolymorpha sp. NPDC004070]|uniref:LpqB family beta-propeller domain-containing protein n=1 Tax=Actinopolymorpha sp. NPDC004070 TaxID=3154548 RepID=UPI00339FAD17
MTAEAHRSRSRGRVVAAALALAVSLAALAACATVPSSGPVMFEGMGTQSATPPSLAVQVNGPEPGDSPQQVARGFLDAMASYQAGQPVARKYLTPAMSERWQPDQVLVYDSTPVPLTEPKSGKVLIDVRRVGGLGVNGDWTSARPGERLRLDLGMTKVAGQWRVGRPPSALVMSIYNFRREYESYNLYFFDPNFEILVPDPIYLPTRGRLETLLVNALLRGPSGWLKPSVRTAFPERTTLAAPSVTVDGNVATVDLDPRVDSLYEPQRRYLLAQLSWTLDQVRQIKKIQVTAGRAPFSIGGNGGSNTTSADQWATYDPRVAGAATGAYALNDGKVVLVGSDRTVLVSSLAGHRIEARSIAVGIFGERSSQGRLGPEDPRGSADWLAAVSTDGRKVNLYGAKRLAPRTAWQGRDLLEPSWDRTGKLWMVDRNRGRARIEVLDERDRLGTVDAPGLNGKDVRALKISREGSRAAVLVQHGNRTVLMVGRVERGEGLAIRGLREIPLDLTRMTDLAWSQLDEVTVIGSEGQAGASRALKVTVDGYSSTPLTGPDATSLSAAPGQLVLLGGSDGVLHREDKTYMWSNQGAGRCPAYPG